MLELKLEQVKTQLYTIADEYAPAALASSLGAEDMVLTDLICKFAPGIEIFTLDTGRLPEETYALMQTMQRHYGRNIRTYSPQAEVIEEFVRNHGPNAFYESVEHRKTCCHIRKVEPLQRALAGKRAWLSGIRREQSMTRTDAPLHEWDSVHTMQKFNPLIEWHEQDVWNYLRKFDVPYNALHDKGYPSIGCAPCTRAISVGEDIRAGRWWWENEDEQGKECGLHRKTTGEVT